MPWFAVSLLLDCRVADGNTPSRVHELAIHIVKARNEADANTRATEIGSKRQHAYLNLDNKEVSWVFQRVVECQELFDHELVDGMEVSSWLYEGDRLCLNDGWSPTNPESTETTEDA